MPTNTEYRWAVAVLIIMSLGFISIVVMAVWAVVQLVGSNAC